MISIKHGHWPLIHGKSVFLPHIGRAAIAVTRCLKHFPLIFSWNYLNRDLIALKYGMLFGQCPKKILLHFLCFEAFWVILAKKFFFENFVIGQWPGSNSSLPTL